MGRLLLLLSTCLVSLVAVFASTPPPPPPPPAAAAHQPPVHPSWGKKPSSLNPKDLAWLGVGLPDVGDGKAVSDHGRPVDGSDALTNLTPATTAQLVRRAIFLAFTFMLPVLLSWLALLSTWFRDRVWYPLLVRCIASSGAAFIKWGQWSSTRPDMFPEALCRALSTLHSNAPVHGAAHTRARVEAMFGGRRVEDVFDWFDMAPMASGSIAQIHKAILAGRLVAVKVRHPQVAEKMAMDFRIMKWLASVTDATPALRWMNLGPSMEQFGHTMGAQTRLDVEARHLILFQRNFKSWPECSFPVALCCVEDVLIETFEEGQLISTYFAQYNAPPPADGVAAPARDGSSVTQMSPSLCHFVVSRGEDMYLKMLLQDNLMHADLHPGNIMVYTGPDEPWDARPIPRLVLVDVGMVAQLEPAESDAFIALLQCLGAGDGAAAARAVLRFAARQTCAPGDAAAFESDMAELFTRVCGGYGTGVDVGVVLRGVLGLVRRHRVRIDVNYATLIMNVLCLDGLAAGLLPSYSILDNARPLLEAHRALGRRGRLGGAVLRIALPLAQRSKRRQDQWIEAQAVGGRHTQN
eukprot:TRINITY_DN1824_c2_g1_i1.p1 TRINITY_DN1824_c2_g1~~TRINITY_DN1824_c2_g1_i1.p1  ORF type:complete len:579 (+),score=217.37 TRINITY_DN1824_c2_g1_i1:170-1906(+)